MWYGTHGDHRISTGPREQVDGGVDLLRATERRGRLEQYQDLWAIRFAPLKGIDEVEEDIDHRSVVARQMRRAKERHLGTEPLGRGHYVLIVSADHHSTENGAPAGCVDGMGDERSAAEQRQILAWNRLRTTARRDDTKDGQYRIRFCTCNEDVDRTSAMRAPACPLPYMCSGGYGPCSI